MVNRIKQFLGESAKIVNRVFNKGGKTPRERAKMETRFDNVKLDRRASDAKKKVKALFVQAEAAIKEGFPAGVSRNQALLKLEESFAWVSKSARVATEERGL